MYRRPGINANLPIPVVFLFKCKMAWDFCRGLCPTNKPMFHHFHAFQCILVKSQKNIYELGRRWFKDFQCSWFVKNSFPSDNYVDMHIVHGTVLFWHENENLSCGQILSLWLCEIVDYVVGLSYLSASLWSLAERNKNPICHSRIYLPVRAKNLVFVLLHVWYYKLHVSYSTV